MIAWYGTGKPPLPRDPDVREAVRGQERESSFSAETSGSLPPLGPPPHSHTNMNALVDKAIGKVGTIVIHLLITPQARD